jgi:uncharacterized protein YaiL (DUF2058 family)
LIIPLDYQLAYPKTKSVKALSERIFDSKFQIHKNHPYLQKITKNKKDEITIEQVYPTLNSNGYLQYNICCNKVQICEFAQRLIGYVFCENDNILNKIECDHKDRFTWNNQAKNIRWTTPADNKLNRGVCAGKINIKHTFEII